MEYNFTEIEKKWQGYWEDNKTYKAETDSSKPKYYVLDMFPYPSGAGLHVGHPLGYIASDIYARYKTHKGFNVLHPMGFDAYGLPAEQYAIETGAHPAVTTEKNIIRYKQQLNQIGFAYDWDREVQTCDPKYYKWTQWTFIQLFNSWFNNQNQKAEKIDVLIKEFEQNGSCNVDAACNETEIFSAKEWKQLPEKEQQELLMNYRLAYLSDSWVNWCPELGTVLANDEVVNGVSERGGYAVEQKLMKQWSLRITAYAQRLLEGLNDIDWPENIKEVQRNWIGRSEGASVNFKLKGFDDIIEVFTTRPDTLYGATFMVLAPEYELVEKITSDEQKKKVDDYVLWTKKRSERERQAEVKNISGVFTGAYGINPLNNEKIPIWIADSVLMGYGTGAIMAVPAHDSRDFAFAKYFELPIIQVVSKKGEDIIDTADWNESYDAKKGVLIHSPLINGMEVKQAIFTITKEIEKKKTGYGTINFRLRDAIFSRQRYWGEPFPVYYKDEMPYMMDEKELPLLLPEVDKYLPTDKGDPPLARAKNWKTKEGYPIETNTMPGFAGSSAYYLRYMDPKNDDIYFSKEANEYWRNVDLYLGGDEHATGHLIYARFWNHFLYDIGLVCEKEPFKRLINQGKIQGRSNFVYRIKNSKQFVSFNLRKNYEINRLHVDVSIVENDVLNIDKFRKWRPEYNDAEFILEDDKYVCGWEVEKMSKSKYNVVNPDALIKDYGADTLRLYEMFLGPIEQHKPWNTNGIEGVFRFLKKLWRLFHDENNKFCISNDKANDKELKILHKTIKKIEEDILHFSYNTAVSAFMVCVNKLNELQCNKKEILSPLAVLISPFAPHLAEELWQLLGNNSSVTNIAYPKAEEKYLIEDTVTLPVQFNGKKRYTINIPSNMSNAEVEKMVLNDERSQKWLQGKPPRKVIVVPKRIVNVVL